MEHKKSSRLLLQNVAIAITNCLCANTTFINDSNIDYLVVAKVLKSYSEKLQVLFISQKRGHSKSLNTCFKS